MLKQIFLSTIGISIILYVVVMLFFVYVKPAFLYDHDKKQYKQFKTGSDGTVFPIWGIAIFMGIASYLAASYLQPYLNGNISSTVQTPTPISHSTLPQQSPAAVSSPFLSNIINGGSYQPMDMCMANSCFAAPPMMGGGSYLQPSYNQLFHPMQQIPSQPMYNLPASKVWKKL